jgi:hypothetical protein
LQGIVVDKLLLRFLAHALLSFEDFLDTALQTEQGHEVLILVEKRGWVNTSKMAADGTMTADALKGFIKVAYLSYFTEKQEVLYREVDANGEVHLHEALVTEVDSEMYYITNRTGGTQVFQTTMASLERVDDTY